jgi:hypothetical protein
MSVVDPGGGDQGAGCRGIPESFRVHFKEDKPWTRLIKSDGTPAGTVLVNPSRPPHAQWLRPSTYTDTLPDDEYRDFLRSCGHKAARIERGEFGDDEEPDVDLFAEPASYQREPETSPDGAQANRPESGPTATQAKPPTTPSLTLAARAIGAAYQLRCEGKPVSLRAVCALEHIDRANLRKNHPQVVGVIAALSTADRGKPRGLKDARTGKLDGVDDPAGRLKSGRRRSKPIGHHDAGEEESEE